jgi:hypothetical protein
MWISLAQEWFFISHRVDWNLFSRYLACFAVKLPLLTAVFLWPAKHAKYHDVAALGNPADSATVRYTKKSS